MRKEWVELQEICDLNMGQSPKSSSYNDEEKGLPFFQGNADFGDLHPTIRKWCTEPKKIVEEDSLLISVRAPIGALNFTTERCCIGRGLAGITPKEDINLKYVYYNLKFRSEELKDKGTGSTFKAINKGTLAETRIKDRPYEEQTMCVEVLDRVSSIIDYRKEELEHLDNLVKSRFVEMFGDISKKVELSHYIESLTAGKSLAGTEACDNKVLKTGAVSYDYFDENSVKNLPLDFEPLERNKVKSGDVIISRMNTAELVGATAYVWSVGDNIYLPDRLWRAEINMESANPIFLWQVLIQETTKYNIRRIASGTSGSMKNISKKALLNLKVIEVEIDLQNEFSDFIQQVNKLKLEVQKSLDETQTLFDSLMQKYFE